MTRASAEAHQRKHFGAGIDTLIKRGAAAQQAMDALTGPGKPFLSIKSRMNGTETEYSLILEAMKRRGEINEWRFGAVKLAWGEDPETGKPMFYTPDFVIWKDGGQEPFFFEVKGPYIHPKDWIRFKGCRARWPRYRFELHQKREGVWVRLL